MHWAFHLEDGIGNGLMFADGEISGIYTLIA
jgi:hypothetical protein